MPKKSKNLCVDDLRHAEYYGMQPVFDELYRRSLDGDNFTDLMDIILSRDNILLAYRNIKANGGSYTAGTDNKNISDIGCLPPETVVEKVRFIVTGSQHGYRPKPVRRKDIPKPNGKTRPLGIPCIWDRLVQQCIKQVMEPICEAKFSDNSYGFRPNRSVEHAINRSKIKDASDTNADFDDLDSAIRSGYFLKQGLSNNEDFYYMNLLITITANNLEELQWRIQEMKKLLISQDMDLRSCYFLQEQGFLSSLPLVSLDKKLYELSKRNTLTTGAASCYPFVSYSICDDNGILFGVNKHNNSLVIADIFDSKQYKNSNISILGTSGAGKTFTMQTMALRMRRKGIQVFIIAPLKGHEFYRAARNVGGTFIQISPASKNCINVMEIRKVDNSVNELLDGPTLDASALAGKIQRLHVFFSLLIPDMSHEEKQLLDEALIKTYARKGITHKNESLIDPKHPDQYKEMPILGDVYNVLMESEDTKRLAHILNRLVHGSASSFNQQTNVDLSNKYTVLDISELTGSSDLLTVGMFVALDFVWDKAKENRTEEKAIFVDEVWQLIGASSNRLAAEFVLEIAKIIRAYSGAGIFATQDLNDFFALDDGKYGKGIINNCKTKIILNMEDEEAQRVKNILHLSETEVMNITHFQRGNGLISTNNNNITVEFKASNLEKELITTDRQELLEILKRQNEKAG